MRLAALMHRTVAELRETMDAEEWSRWLFFHSLYDLPDAFLVTGVLGALISRVVGGKGEPHDFAPFYKIDSKPASPRTNNLRPAYDFLASYAKDRSASGNPIPGSSRRGSK
jgi:hypothetical protein